MAPDVCSAAEIPVVFEKIERPLAFLNSEESYEKICNVYFYWGCGGSGAQRWPGLRLWLRGLRGGHPFDAAPRPGRHGLFGL
jgi:hypothetical protein